MKTGMVSIVGAGPGDPELITVKALRLIQLADVILYDRLVNRQLLAEARPDVQLVYCGKSPGAHTMPQEHIHRKLIEYAIKGNRVVRLKGGDPFIFGRGGEEALAMAEQGIPYEVVPGVTSALGAASAADIPLTHRGMSASVAFVTGSRCPRSDTQIRWDLLAHSVDTLVIYMGIAQLEQIRLELMAHGKAADTPVAIIERASTDQQRTVTGTLGFIHNQAAAMRIRNPALIVIGESVKVREQLNRLVMEAAHKVG